VPDELKKMGMFRELNLSEIIRHVIEERVKIELARRRIKDKDRMLEAAKKAAFQLRRDYRQPVGTNASNHHGQTYLQPKHVDPRLSDIKHSCADVGKAREVLDTPKFCS